MFNIDTAKLQLAKDILSNYTEDTELQYFNIIHIYPNYETKLIDNDCFDSCLKFQAVIYNTETRYYKKLANYHDKLELVDYYTKNILPLSHLNVFADGSTLVMFNAMVKVASHYLSQVIELTTKV